MLETLADLIASGLPVVRFVILLSPIWLPIVLFSAAWKAWVYYRRVMFIMSKQPVVLEIRIPREVNKSPKAMELALNAFYATGGEGSWKDKYWKGGVRPWSSLEIASIEGQVKFFIWTWKENVKSIQNNFYAQYPSIEIAEVPDYTLGFVYDNDKADLTSSEFGLTKPDPYPIKTYVDYGLDKDPKEEFKVDPITPVLEYLGGLGKGEQAWIQILIRAHKAEAKKPGGIFAGIKAPEDIIELVPKIQDQLKPIDPWKEDVKKEIDNVVKKRKIQLDKEGKASMGELTPVERETIEALDRSVTKLPFDVGIRAVYLGEKDAFNPAHKGALNGVWAQYSTQHLNGFKKTGGDSGSPGSKLDAVSAFRDRGWFHPPHQNPKRKPFVLNAEELATIYHFPGGVAQTPTFSRIESKKAEPPVNLPV